MPRLDNSSRAVIEHFELKFDPDDPGKTEPLDFCADCWLSVVISNGLEDDEIEHPPYGEDTYWCHTCDSPLVEDDDIY